MNPRLLILLLFFKFLAIQANVLKEIFSELSTNLSGDDHLSFEDEPILGRSVMAQKRLKEQKSRTERSNETSSGCVNNWPSLPSTDEIEGTWKLETDYSKSSPESDCLRVTFTKHNSTSMILTVIYPTEVLEYAEPRSPTFLCYVVDNFYSCFERNGERQLFRFTPQTPLNRYMILGSCSLTTHRHEYIVLTRQNITLLSDDLDNLESLNQELGFGNLHYESCP